MASSTRLRRRNSLDKPPDISDVIYLKEEFIALYERHYHELQECIQALSHLINTFEEDFRHGIIPPLTAAATLPATVAPIPAATKGKS
ncbi:hypothetical protein Q8A67_000144 [Cirrhinus molitorella]|uniref:Uncharacterized protein n=1 Tax=Cirrhinus molitorella TaxID=172907 RepID=A0AA88QJ64_9TELE|nr:hypothetical protein Q8A67_000144 [Cirrhinus molitorella]